MLVRDEGAALEVEEEGEGVALGCALAGQPLDAHDRGMHLGSHRVDGCRLLLAQVLGKPAAGVAFHLHDRGLAKGERVALWGYNSANWLVAFFAIVRAGGVALLVNYSASEGAPLTMVRPSDPIELRANTVGRAVDGVELRMPRYKVPAHVFSFSEFPLNDRQRKVLSLLVSDFEGKLTARKWAKLCKVSPDTALRDINDLIEKGGLKHDAAGGRSTSYSLR